MYNVRQCREWALSCTCGVLCDGLARPTILWFEISTTAMLAVSSPSSGDVRGITTPALNNPILPTTDFVRCVWQVPVFRF